MYRLTCCESFLGWSRMLRDLNAGKVQGGVYRLWIYEHMARHRRTSRCDTVNGAKDSAIVYSLTEAAKATELKPYEYLKYLLTETPKHMDYTYASFLNMMLPWSQMLLP